MLGIDGTALDPADAISTCCDAPVGEIDTDSVDGLYGVPDLVTTAECSECGQMSGVHWIRD
jgi:hypothetical protein